MSNKALEYYRGLMPIDKHCLDDELEQHPVIYEEIGENLSVALSIRDSAKDAIGKVSARVASGMRRRAKDAGEKVTETQITTDLPNTTEVKEASQEYNDAKLESDQWYALKDAWDQRGKALRELAHLYTAGYWQRKPVKDGKMILDTAEAENIRKQLADKRKDSKLRSDQSEAAAAAVEEEEIKSSETKKAEHEPDSSEEKKEEVPSGRSRRRRSSEEQETEKEEADETGEQEPPEKETSGLSGDEDKASGRSRRRRRGADDASGEESSSSEETDTSSEESEKESEDKPSGRRRRRGADDSTSDESEKTEDKGSSSEKEDTEGDSPDPSTGRRERVRRRRSR